MGGLRSIIRQLIKEGIKESRLQDLALFHHEAKTGKQYYMLFHPDLVEHIVYKFKFYKTVPKMIPKNVAQSEHIYAMAIARPSSKKSQEPCLESWEITLSAAKKGWGPTMYDIVMGDSPNGIMADRYEVSSHAKPIWDFYYKDREDVEKFVLDDKDYQYTSWPKDDCSWGSAGDYSKDMVADHEDFESFEGEKNLWYRDTLNYVYNRWEIKYRQDMEDNYFDALGNLNNNNILTGTVYENFQWWRKIMRIFFNIQSNRRDYR